MLRVQLGGDRLSDNLGHRPALKESHLAEPFVVLGMDPTLEGFLVHVASSSFHDLMSRWSTKNIGQEG
jgi:hypothetical protein